MFEHGICSPECFNNLIARLSSSAWLDNLCNIIPILRNLSAGILIATSVASLRVPVALAGDLHDPFLTDSLESWQLASGNYASPITDLAANSTLIEGGFVSYRGGVVLRVGVDWLNWPGSQGGDIVWKAKDSPSAVLRIGGLSAFGFLLEPQHLSPEPIAVTLSNGQRITQYVSGNSGAQFFGFVGGGITWIRIDDGAGGSFALGEFRAVATSGLLPNIHKDCGSIDAPSFTAAVISGDLFANTYQEHIIGSGGTYNSAGLSLELAGFVETPFRFV